MRKTTEQLARECGDDWDSTLREDKAFMERFRRLAIENERENAEAVEIDWPEYHHEAMGCGLEDRNITDRYDAMQYGWDEAVERCAKRIPEPLFPFPPATNRDAVIEECAEWLVYNYPLLKYRAEEMVRALKSQPATPDPRDEALRIAREALEDSGRIYCTLIGNALMHEPSMFERNVVCKYVRGWFRKDTHAAVVNKALAAIDKAMKGGE